jgi:hypothetical protein
MTVEEQVFNAYRAGFIDGRTGSKFDAPSVNDERLLKEMPTRLEEADE